MGWKKIICLALSGCFLLSSLGFIRLVDQESVADFFGLNEKVIQGNVYFVLVAAAIFILAVVISTLIDIFMRLKISSEIISRGDQYFGALKNNLLKTAIGLFLAVIVQQVFTFAGLYQCIKTPIPGGWAENCGTEAQLIFLMASSILLAFSILPEKIKLRRSD